MNGNLKNTIISSNIAGLFKYSTANEINRTFNRRKMRHIYRFRHHLLGLLVGVLALTASQNASAQCNPTVTGNPCVGTILNFKANAPGYTSWDWDFDDGNSSTQRDPGYAFTAPGTYNVELTASSPTLGTCTKTVTVTVLPSPVANIKLNTPREQCFNGNYFCFRDSSKAAPGSSIVRATYLFEDGDLYEELNPAFPRDFCKDNPVGTNGKSIIDARGGWFGLLIELEDANGCVSKINIDSMVRVFPRLGVELDANGKVGCDSTEGTIINRTYLKWQSDPLRNVGLKDVASFVFDFGDGTIVYGDSVTNTEYWTGPALDAIIIKKYKKTGTFNATLTVTSVHGCTETFTYFAAATNYNYAPVIIADPDSSCTNNPSVQFKAMANGNVGIPGAQFLWNFGNPPTGQLNFNNNSWTPAHDLYGAGPWMISLNIKVGPCDLWVYDTITKYGPTSTIEIPFVRIAEHEKYQCVIKDSVHFVNNSTFYHDDPIWQDEDMIVWFYTKYDTIGGNIIPTDSVFRYAFNFDPVTHTGDQTAIPHPSPVRNKDHVLRIWTLGDNYAPGCTTDTKANKNVNLNCNYTLDSLPVHWYTPWDEIYYTNNRGRFYKNPFPRTLFSRNSRTCFIVQVYADSIVYIPARLTMGYPPSMRSMVDTDSFLVTMFDKYRTDLFTEVYGVDSVLNVPELDTMYIYVPSGNTVSNNTGATGDIFDLNVVPTVGVNKAVGPGYFRIIGRLGGSTMELETGTTFSIMHEGAEMVYDSSLRECYKGPIIHTMTQHDQYFDLKSGVTVNVKDLQSGNVTTHTGPKTLTIEKDYQFEITTTDSLCPIFWSEVEADDRVVAQTSFFHKDTVINGRDTFVSKQVFFIDSAYHRDYFYQEIAQCNTVTLWHKDTVHPHYCESTSNVSLALIPPNARGMEWESGTPCVVVPGAPFNPNYYFTFTINQTKPGCTQQWFEVNYDTLAGINNWVPFNSGGVLAPPPPGIPIPFILPYQIVGSYGTTFVKAYTPNQVQIPGVKRLNGAFTLGLVVGNGPPRTNSSGQKIPPVCLDTAYYPNMFSIKYMDPSFDIVLPTGNEKHMCVGDTAYLRVLNPIQEEIKQFALFWNVDDGTNTDLDLKQGAYLETYNYFEEYGGPVTGRNDENVVWDPSKKWLFTFLEMDNYTFIKNTTTNKIQSVIERDTLVTRIYREWEVRANTRNADEAIKDAFEQLGLDIRDIDPADVPLYLGDGTVGCIDTTGISQLFEFYVAPIEKNVVTHGKYKYKYTDLTQTDSVIIEEVFHYRDTSLRGDDTAIAPFAFTSYTPKDTISYKKGDIIPNVYTLNFKYPILIPDPCDPDPALSTLGWEDVRGVVHTYVSVENLDGCQSSNSKDIIVGFFNMNRLAEEAVCKGSPHFINDSIRYFTTDDLSYPLTYPILPIAYWEDPARYAIRELKYVDWDANDGIIDYETSIKFSHIYDVPGTYTINYAMRDSNNCVDTIQLTAYVTGLDANFETNLQQLACQNIVTFFDSTIVFDPCRGRDTCPDPSYEPCDSIVYWEWDFGDGSRTSFLKSPSHDYTSSGWFTVKLIVRSALDCIDSVEKQIFIPGPQPNFEINNNPWGPDSIIICVGDAVDLTNLSGDPMYDPEWVMHWGDGRTSSYSDLLSLMSHTYDSVGVFYLRLFMNDEVPGVTEKCKNEFPDTSTGDGKIPRKIKVIVQPISPASFVPVDTTVCPNEPIIFTNTSDQIYTRLVWSFGDGDTITRIRTTSGDTITHRFPNAGVYNITLEPDYDLPPGDFGPKCLDTASGTVTVEEVRAAFGVNAANSPNFCFIDSSLNAVKWSWTFQDENGENYSDKQNPCYDWGERIGTWEVCLAVENSNGCTDTICQSIDNFFRTVIIPYNVFTPDEADNLNKKFVVDVESHEEYDIKIYNRWGELVFKSTDPANPWDGTVMNEGNECPAGTYYYIINYKLRGREFNDGFGPIEGMVTLIRD